MATSTEPDLLADTSVAVALVVADTRPTRPALPAHQAGDGGRRRIRPLVGTAARYHRLPLATRDNKGVGVYRTLEVDVEVRA